MEFLNTLISISAVELLISFYTVSSEINKYLDSCTTSLSENLGYRKRFTKFSYLYEYYINNYYSSIDNVSDYYHSLVKAPKRILLHQYYRMTTVPSSNEYYYQFIVLYTVRGVTSPKECTTNIENAIHRTEDMGYTEIANVAYKIYKLPGRTMTFDSVSQKINKFDDIFKHPKLAMTNMDWLKEFRLTRDQVHKVIYNLYGSLIREKSTIPYDYNLIHLIIKYIPCLREYLMSKYTVDPNYDMFLEDGKPIKYYRLPNIFVNKTPGTCKKCPTFNAHKEYFWHIIECKELRHGCCIIKPVDGYILIPRQVDYTFEKDDGYKRRPIWKYTGESTYVAKRPPSTRISKKVVIRK